MPRIGQGLLRWSVLGQATLWMAFVVLLMAAVDTDGIVADVARTGALLLPTAWAYMRPGPLSGAVVVAVAWPLV